MENTPEYQEYRLKVDGIKWIETKIKSMQGSLIDNKKKLKELKVSLVKKCADSGHDYGVEHLEKTWVEKIVYSRSRSCGLSPMDGYDYDDDDRQPVDEGSYSHYMVKRCKWCEKETKRHAVPEYK